MSDLRGKKNLADEEGPAKVAKEEEGEAHCSDEKERTGAEEEKEKEKGGGGEEATKISAFPLFCLTKPTNEVFSSRVLFLVQTQ